MRAFSSFLSKAISLIGVVALCSSAALAADRYIAAQSFTKTLPGGVTVPMWGFAECTVDATNNWTCGAATVPGPQINILGNEALDLHVRNDLKTPISVVIPGLRSSDDGKSVTTAANGTLQSMTQEVSPGQTYTYHWGAGQTHPGTFLYMSGTHSPIQVPMGLYGAVRIGVAANPTNAVYSGVRFDQEAVALFSEIDPVQNAAVAQAAIDAGAGQIDPSAYPRILDYNPTYFLINGKAFDPANKTASELALANAAPASGSAAPAKWTVLLRFLNAGLRSHAPAMSGLDFTIVGEDGNRYMTVPPPGSTATAVGTPRNESTLLLPAGKTLDVLVSPPKNGSGATSNFNSTFSLFDRMLDLSNNNATTGGMIAYLKVGTGGVDAARTAPVANDDTYAVIEDTPFSANVLSNDPGLSNAVLFTPPANGTVQLNANGTFTYTPAPNYSGPDAFSYIAQNSLGVKSNVAKATIGVSFLNDPPIANADGPYTNTVGTTITVKAPGILANDTDADGDSMQAVLVGTAPGLTPTMVGNQWLGGFTYTAAVGPHQFTYRAKDSTGALSDPVTVTLDIGAPSALALNVVGPSNEAVTEYRWLVEEDATFHHDPSQPNAPSLGTNFHASYMPVVAQGCVGSRCTGPQVPISDVVLDKSKWYFVSVLPSDATDETGHTVGGASLAPNQQALTVRVNVEPMPTAQISVLIFEDNFPTNGAVDGNEQGLGNFQIQLEEVGGRYGQNGGTVSQDVYGNPLKNWLDCAPPQNGIILSCPDGRVLIKNLAPGKYSIGATPPANSTIKWSQTTTIEGGRFNDAWVMAGEPAYFQEFGPPGYHVFHGFVSPDHNARLNGPNTVTGRITNLRMARPGAGDPTLLYNSNSHKGLEHTTAWVGLNSDNGQGVNIATVKTNDDGTFSIKGVPNGTYQLVVWDEYLDQIISYRSFAVPATAADPQGGNLGDVPVFNWFGRLENYVYLDANKNGVRDPGEPGLKEQNFNIRFRDGSIERSTISDTEGYAPFDEVFPYFNWQIAEVDYTRWKATGMTATIDRGGAAGSFNMGGETVTGLLNPQQQADGSYQRTELREDKPSATGPLLEAFQSFLGLTNVIEWGKAPYDPGENGGIVGIVHYASTRAENDPRWGVADNWEPGIPRVKVRLYKKVKRADGTDGLVFQQEVKTDSWDDLQPTDCPGQNLSDPFVQKTIGTANATKCYDGMHSWNQIRPGVFDGGFAFVDVTPGTYVVEMEVPPGYELVKEEDKNVEIGDSWVSPVAMMLPNLAAVTIMPDQALVADVVKAAAADGSTPGNVFQPVCVGDTHRVPQTLALFPTDDAPYAGTDRPLCDRKEVLLTDMSQANADFFLFTSTPIAGHIQGMILDDLSQEFDTASPQWGEKWAPPFMPITVRDHRGIEINRLYADQWGMFNGLVPSTFAANIPLPSGYSPAMWQTCMNDPGSGNTPDPNYNPMYTNFCYTLQYMPGTTTYLDTPVLPTAAFASGYDPVDCALPAGTPVVKKVTTSGIQSFNGPYLKIPATAGGDTQLTVTITSMGTTSVLNPDYQGPLANAPYNQKLKARDFGFGSTRGTVKLNGTQVPNANVTTWNDGAITLTFPTTQLAGCNQTTTAQFLATCRITAAMLRTNSSTYAGQMSIARAGGSLTSVTSIYLTIDSGNPRVVSSGGSIQAAIDAAAPGDVILVEPGNYDELVVMWKPVRLQGAGAGSVKINAAKFPTEKLANWRAKVQSLVDSNLVTLIPGQGTGTSDGVGDNAPGLLGTEEGAGITVMGKIATRNNGGRATNPESFEYQADRQRRARIDGFSITGGDGGGGVFVNGYAYGLEISNNDIFGNNGQIHGGLRFGHPFTEGVDDAPLGYGYNVNASIHNNAIRTNGAFGDLGAGGGISLCNGTDNYRITSNWICGNFTEGDGGGIGHLGLSQGGEISNNKIVFNQSFSQGTTHGGGGIYIGGEAPAAATGLSFGSGSVTIQDNLIQGNHAGAGHGGGIRLERVNGTDVARLGGAPPSWYKVNINRNTIVNNEAGWSGGAIAMLDAVYSSITNNTIANNDSTATVGSAFGSNPAVSNNQVAGISSEPNSALLDSAIGGNLTGAAGNLVRQLRGYSHFVQGPVGLLRLLVNNQFNSNIIWHNRTFHFDGSVAGNLVPQLTQSSVGACPSGATYWDTGIVGQPSSVPIPTAGGNNTTSTPNFITPYCNGSRARNMSGEATTLPGLDALAAGDEGGNWIDVRWGPLSPVGNYGLGASVPLALNAAPLNTTTTTATTQSVVNNSTTNNSTTTSGASGGNAATNRGRGAGAQ